MHVDDAKLSSEVVSCVALSLSEEKTAHSLAGTSEKINYCSSANVGNIWHIVGDYINNSASS